MVKTTNIENNYIARIKIINKIQCIKTFKNHVALWYIYLFLLNICDVLLNISHLILDTYF